MSTKKEQRELKKPDLFQTRAREELEKIKQKPGLLIAILAILGISVGGYFFNAHYQNTQLEKRVSQIYAVDSLHKEELAKVQKETYALYNEMTENNKTIMDLEAKKTLTKPEKSKLKKLKDKLDKIMASLKTIRPDHKKSSEGYLKFYEEHPSTQEGRRAASIVIQNLLNNKSYKEAKELSQKVLKDMPKSSLFYGSLLRLHIKVLSELSELDLALSKTEKLLAENSPKEQAQTLLLKGIILLQKEDKEEAQKTFERIITHFHATAELKSQARAYKALIF